MFPLPSVGFRWLPAQKARKELEVGQGGLIKARYWVPEAGGGVNR